MEESDISHAQSPVRPPATASLPLVGNIVGLSLDPLSFQTRRHKRFGPVFSAHVFGRRLVFVDTAGDGELAEQFFGAPEDQLDVIGAYRGLLGGLLGEDLFVPIARELRAALAGSYARRHLPASVDAALLFLRAQVELSPTIDLGRLCSDMVLRLLIDFMMGGELSETETSELCDAFDLIESDYSVLGMLFPIRTPAFRRRVAARDSIRELVRAAIQRRRRRPDPPDDLLQHLLTHARIGAGEVVEAASIEEVCLQIVGMVFAAHTNTAMTLTLCLVELVKRPKILAATRREVLRSVSEGGSSAPPSIVYRVVTECVRLHSLGSCWRLAVRDQEISGFQILAGEYVGTSLGRINLDPMRFRSPDEFYVDRDPPPIRARVGSLPVPAPPIASAGFGAGRHLCPGRTLAQSVLGLLLSALVTEYQWRLESEPVAWQRLMFPGVNRPIGAVSMRAHEVGDAPTSRVTPADAHAPRRA